MGNYVIKKKSALREWVEAFFVALILVVFLRTFFFQLYKIPTNSMVPTLLPHDKIFVSKITYGPKVPFTNLRIQGFKKPNRGDVIVFVPPHDRKRAYVKRLIGLGGERILIKDGNVYIDGKICVDPKIAINFYHNQGSYARIGEEIEIPKGKYFLLGDYSISSLDSRFWGFVDEKDIIGKVIFIWWPPKRIGIVE